MQSLGIIPFKQINKRKNPYQSATKFTTTKRKPSCGTQGFPGHAMTKMCLTVARKLWIAIFQRRSLHCSKLIAISTQETRNISSTLLDRHA